MFYNSVSGFLHDVTNKVVDPQSVEFIIGGTAHDDKETMVNYYMWSKVYFSLTDDDRLQNKFSFHALTTLSKIPVYQPRKYKTEKYFNGLIVPNWFCKNQWDSVQEFCDTLNTDKQKGVYITDNDIRIFLLEHDISQLDICKI